MNVQKRGGCKGWQLYSVSRWNKEDGKKLKKHLEQEFLENRNTEIYWDDIALFCYPNEYKLGIRKMNVDDIIELDSISELANVDKKYIKYLNEVNK